MPRYALVMTGPDIDKHGIKALPDFNPPEILAPGRACQWRMSIEDAAEAASVLATFRADYADFAVDVNLVPDDEHRRKRLLIADMDSTIIEQECIDEIADMAGYGAEVAAITERAMRGELDFEEALRVRVALLKGLDTATLDRVIAERITLSPGAKTLVATMHAHGARTALVSGGFTFFTSRIAEMVGFDENRANTLEIRAGKLTGEPVPPILGRQAKLDALNEISRGRNIPMAATLAVGDGANDLAMIEAAGLGIAYHAKPVVSAKANAHLDHSDLTALLYLQGYRLEEFAC